jgi:hypothetical protein
VDVGTRRMHKKVRYVENVLFGRTEKKEMIDVGGVI